MISAIIFITLAWTVPMQLWASIFITVLASIKILAGAIRLGIKAGEDYD